jgi:hypothetical protein
MICSGLYPRLAISCSFRPSKLSQIAWYKKKLGRSRACPEMGQGADLVNLLARCRGFGHRGFYFLGRLDFWLAVLTTKIETIPSCVPR